ncbi:hypothetical protein BYT27DRAFT_7254581 [Phlegmacium glaucopus]|nr:hypothetical protein BYT27DRAFT_7254581 [Phlegmacium glaucopus]
MAKFDNNLVDPPLPPLPPNLIPPHPILPRLEKNKQLEADNNTQTTAKINHRLNPENYPADGSDLTSLLTIDEADLNQLLDDDIHTQYQPVMPITITK